MNILGLDTSAKAASCAVLKDGRLFCECFSDAGLQHSQTLMPMLRDMLRASGISLGDIDALAVAEGPGSFTGVRIGVAAVKGLAFPGNLPCAGVSSLLAMAYNVTLYSGIVLPVMDARRGEFYAAAFRVSGPGKKPERLFPDCAVSAEKLLEKLKDCDEEILVLGDGAELLVEKRGNFILAPENSLRQRAYGVCAAAYSSGQWLSAEDLKPVYLRLSQAEREYSKKKAQQNGISS